MLFLPETFSCAFSDSAYSEISKRKLEEDMKRLSLMALVLILSLTAVFAGGQKEPSAADGELSGEITF